MACEFRDPKDIRRDLWTMIGAPFFKCLGFIMIMGSIFSSMVFVDVAHDNNMIIEGWLWIPYILGHVSLFLSIGIGVLFVILLLVAVCTDGKAKVKEIFCKNP